MNKRNISLFIFFCCVVALSILLYKLNVFDEHYTNLHLHSDHEMLDYIRHECKLPCK